MSRSRRYLFKWIVSFAQQHSIKLKKLTVKKYVEDHIDSFQVNFPSLYHLKPSENLWSFIFFRWSKGEHWPEMGKPYMNFHAWNDTSVFLWVLLNFLSTTFLQRLWVTASLLPKPVLVELVLLVKIWIRDLFLPCAYCLGYSLKLVRNFIISYWH